MILNKIEVEAEECFLPIHEYVIDEMQYEIRSASQLINTTCNGDEIQPMWKSNIAKKYGKSVANEFVLQLVRNRQKRNIN